MSIVAYYFEPGTEITIDWGDGVVQSYGGVDGEGTIVDPETEQVEHIEAIHNYVEDGLYDLNVTGHITGVLNQFYNLVDLKQWGETAIDRFGADPGQNLKSLFEDVTGFTISAVDAPTFPENTSLERLFSGCIDFNSSFNHWDTDNVINLRSFLEGCIEFNQPINGLRTGRVSDMGWMLAECVRFNQPINALDTVSCTNMEAMLYFAEVFNQPMDQLNTSNVQTMFSMFNGAAAFDQDISMWPVANVGECKWFAENSPINNTEKMPALTCQLTTSQ